MDQIDLDSAVSAGILRSDQADALRRFDERQRGAPSATEERFGLISGFADVMAAVGIALVIGTSISLVSSFTPAALAYPFAAWRAAVYFTAQRRMMLTSMLLFLTFALGVALGSLALGSVAGGLSPSQPLSVDDNGNVVAVFVAGTTSLACWLYWRRFKLPIAVAATVLAFINLLVCMLRMSMPNLGSGAVDLVYMAAGPALFALAMWWDMSDVRRETVRSDVAFWLHVLAGFLLVKGAMALVLGRMSGADGWSRMFASLNQVSGGGEAIAILALFVLFSLVALIVDRRSLLTSGMIYFVPALASLIGGGATAVAPALLVAGLLLTTLAVKWTAFRAALLLRLPAQLVAQLPRPQLKAMGPRPVY